MNRREYILAATKDLVGDLMYYGRKEDQDLPVDAIQAAVAAGEITTQEIIDTFAAQLRAVEGMS